MLRNRAVQELGELWLHVPVQNVRYRHPNPLSNGLHLTPPRSAADPCQIGSSVESSVPFAWIAGPCAC